MLRVLLLVGSWCDKCGIARELKEGCEVLLVWERVFVLGDLPPRVDA